MSERTPQQLAASKAETERQRNLNAQRTKNRTAFLAKQATAKATKKADAIRDAAGLDDNDLRNAWYYHYIGDANFNGTKASELAGYAKNNWKLTGTRNKKHFAKRIADYFENHGFSRSDAIAINLRAIEGFSKCAVLFEDEERYGEMDHPKTIANLKEHGYDNLFCGYKNGQPVYLDVEKAIDRLVQMSGYNAPVKISGTLTLDGLTPAQIQEKANEVLARVVERQQKLLNLPADVDDDDIPEAEIVDDERLAAEAELDGYPI